MSATRADLEPCLQRVLEAGLGTTTSISDFTRVRGGTKKGVYRAVVDGRAVILYVWNHSERYWPAGEPTDPSDVSDSFADASGADLFVAANQCLRSLGVRTPELYFLDTSRAELPADVAIVEDIQGGTIEEYWLRCPDDVPRIMAELGDMLQVIHARHSPWVGKIASSETRVSKNVRCEQLACTRALAHLDHAASRISRLDAAKDALEDVLQSLYGTIAPRTEYSLIHGELGPDHVLVDAQGHPAIIDIEGLMFFDVEWEQAFLAFRFGDHYRWLRESGVDEARLRFYSLCLHLSLCSGPLRLLEGPFPERELMTGIIESNVTKALAFVR